MSGRSIAAASRYALAEAAIPLGHGTGAAAYEMAIRRLSERWSVDVLLPISEGSLLSLLPIRDRLGGVRVPFPASAVFHRICDRAELLASAAELGIAVPTQRVLSSVEEVASLRSWSLAYPVVLKPARSTTEIDGQVIKNRVLYAEDVRELERCLVGLPACAYPVLLQRRVVGPAVGVFLLVREGKTVAIFSHRRIREKPPSGGVSVCCESISADPELVRLSRALLDRFRWEGVAMVEWKIDEATGVSHLMEVNARFWGSLQLAIDAGVDFPMLLIDGTAGGAESEVGRYQVGVRNRWWWGDVDHTLARLRRSPRQLSLPPTAPSRWETLRDVLQPWRPGQRDAVFRWSDPLPFVRETLRWFAALFDRGGQASCKRALAADRTLGREVA